MPLLKRRPPQPPPQTEDLSDLHANIIPQLLELMDRKDPETTLHSSRVQKIIDDVIPELIRRRIIRRDDQALLWVSAILHDIGKLFIRDEVLGSPRTLTETEYAHIRDHPLRGYNLLRQMGLPQPVLDVVRHHHERWDGRKTGRFPAYPDGLKGRRIPLFARIVALADTYDALVCDRPYRKGLSATQARAVIRRNLGTQFDPSIGRTFLKALERLEQTSRGPMDGSACRK